MVNTGIKKKLAILPLYIYVNNKELYLASKMKTLVAFAIA